MKISCTDMKNEVYFLFKTENVHLQTFAKISTDVQGSKAPSVGATRLKPRVHSRQYQHLWTWEVFSEKVL